MSVTAAAQQMSALEERTPERARDMADALHRRVLVSVLNYRGVDDSIATVKSLRRQDYPNFRLQLLDNASPDDCVEQIRAQLPGSTFV